MQVDQSFQTDCIEAVKETMFDPSSQQQHHQPGDQQHLQQGQQHDPSEKASLPDFPFCYSTNLVPKVQVQQQANSTESDKGSYRFEVAQPFNCNYALVNQMSLANTITYKCDICGLVFAHLSLLNHHKRIHSNNSISLADRIFACDVCGATFTQLSDMKAHLQTAHTSNKCSTIQIECDHSSNKKSKFTETDQFDTSNISNSVRPSAYSHTRDACTATDDSLLQAEIKKPPPVKKKTLATITKCPKCNGSGIIVIGNVQNVVEKPYHCNICDSSFSRYSSLWSHRRLHSGEKPFKCDLCGSTFARASSLKNHNRVHTGERPYKCNVCGMQFSQAHHLKSHERIHSGERPYECEVCGKTFARHSTLWNHRRIHTGEKPYRCDICGSAFHQATHLKNHSKVHTGEKPHRCDICDVGFSDRFALKRHRAIHEKYGQTSRGQPARPPTSRSGSLPPWKQSQNHTDSQSPEEIDSHMYKCDASSIKQQQSQQEQSQIDEIYNNGSIAFPGCSRPSEK